MITSLTFTEQLVRRSALPLLELRSRLTGGPELIGSRRAPHARWPTMAP